MALLDEFTTVYKKSRYVLNHTHLHKRWSNIESQMKALLAPGGPDSSQASVLETIRTSLQKAGKGHLNHKAAVAQEILDLARSDKDGFQDRAALIKLFKHFYYVCISGNQDCWVADHPKRYHQWCYDELDGKTVPQTKHLLEREREAFGAQRRKIMSDSLQHARKWANDICIKLGKPNDDTLKIIKRWFHASGDSEKAVKHTAHTLLRGFRKIAATCNSTKVIFSDHPPERTGGKYKRTFAEVSSVDKMPVIYIFPFFFMEAGINNRGQVGKMWLCALTIIHELSHKLAGTDDNSYDTLGLKPGGRNLTVADAIKTADSWGYFAADICGALPDADFKKYYK
jgi:hypothetical protein